MNKPRANAKPRVLVDAGSLAKRDGTHVTLPLIYNVPIFATTSEKCMRTFSASEIASNGSN